MRRLEVIDEEKRARRSEMHHCGINTWQTDEIPFGVRALQPGHEVEGIWVSRARFPQLSQVTSSATLLTDPSRGCKWKDDPSQSLRAKSDTQFTSESTTIDQALHVEPRLCQTPLSSDSLHRPGATQIGTSLPGSSAPPDAGEIRSYIPTGWHEPTVVPQTDETTTGHPSSNALPENRAFGSFTPTTAPFGIQPHGVVEVHANKATRRPNKNFEVLPAGTFGPRHELGPTSSDDQGEDVQLPRFQPGPAKLRKKKTRKRGDGISGGS